VTAKDRPTVRQQLLVLADLYWLLLLMAGDRFRERLMPPRRPALQMADGKAPTEARSRAA